MITGAPTAVQKTASPEVAAGDMNTRTPDAVSPVLSPPINPQNADQIRESGSYPFEYPYRLTFSPDGSQVIVTGGKQIARLTVPDLQLDRQMTLSESDSLLAVSPAGDLIAATGDHETVDIYSLTAGQKVYTVRPRGPFSALFFVPESTLLGIVKVDEIGVDVVDYMTGKQVNHFGGFETAAPVYNVFPSPNGKTLAWVSRGRIQLMDYSAGQLGPEFSHEDFISGWDLSADGAMLATSAGGDLDGEFSPLLYLWDARTGLQIDALKLPDTPAMSVAFSPDGQILAAAAGRDAMLYRVSDLALLASLEGPLDIISFLAFSPDGRSLMAAAQDNLVHLWQVVP
jgi:WD40 repeat protein